MNTLKMADNFNNTYMSTYILYLNSVHLLEKQAHTVDAEISEIASGAESSSIAT
jgi:hypothetical protein